MVGLLDRAKDVVGGAKDTGGDAVDVTTDVGSGIADGVWSAGGSTRAAGGEALQGDWGDAAGYTGEGVVNLASGGDAQEWRQDFIDQEGDIPQLSQQAQSNVEGGTIDQATAAYSSTKVGLDALVDNPSGPNVQSGTTTALQAVTPADSNQDIASGFNRAYEGWREARGKPARALGVEDTLTARAVGWGTEVFVEDPIVGATTFLTGADPKTGETNARAEPIDVVDAALIGGPSAAVAGAKGARAADDAARGLFSSSDEAARGGAAAAGGTAAAAGGSSLLAGLGATSLAESMSGALSGAFRIGRSVARSSDEVSSAADDVSMQTTDVQMRSSDLLRSDRSVGTADDVGRTAENLPVARETFENLPSGGATRVSGASSDEVAAAVDDIGLSSADDGTTAFSGLGASLPGSRTVSRVGTRAREGLGNFGQAAAGGLDELTRTLGFSDDAGRSADEFGGGTAADEFTQTASEAAEESMGWFGRRMDAFEQAFNLGPYADEAASAVDDVTQATDDAVADAFGATDEVASSVDDVAQATDEAVETAVRGSDEGGNAALSAGSAADEAAESGGLLSRLNPQNWGWTGRAALAGSGGVLGATATMDLLGIDPMGALGGSGPNLPSSNTIQGSIEAPGSTPVGEPFSVPYEVGLQSGTDQANARLILAIGLEDQWAPLADANVALNSQASETSGQFDVPTGWGPVEPGDYDIGLIASESQGQQALVDRASATFTEGAGSDGGGATGDSSWNDFELVEEWPAGWYLMRQTHKERDEQRFVVAGKRSDGTRIYLNPDGSVSTSPHTFPTVEDAAAAFERWAQRAQNGNLGEDESPDPNAGRPSGGGVTRDVDQSESGPTGALNRAISFARRNPLMAAGGLAATGAVVYWLYKNGYLDGTINRVEGVLGR